MFVWKLLCLIFLLNCNRLVNGYPSDLQNEKCLNYCSNDGICLMVDNNPKCYCLPEWEGERCDFVSKIDYNKKVESKMLARIDLRNTPCTFVPNLCNQRGTCYVDSNNKVTCQCSYPYAGTRCTEMSVCYQYCFNNGVCTETGTSPNIKPSCECEAEYTGERCQSLQSTTTAESTTTTTASTTTDPVCSFLPAGYCNSGQCIVSGTQIICQCPPTHTGEFCETPVGAPPKPTTMSPIIPNSPTNPIIPNSPTNPIMPNSSPNPIASSPPPGVTCLSKPCQNGSTCFNNGNSYFCYCAPQYAGVNCESFTG